MKVVSKRTVIIFGSPLHTTTALIRSLAGKGFLIVVIIEPCQRKFSTIHYSRYIHKTHYLEHIEEAVPLLLENYTDFSYKPAILCSSDSSISILDRNYNLLVNHFIFFNAGEQGKINKYLDKINTFSIAESSGFSLIRTWYVPDKHNLPSDITFPCLTKGNNSTESTKGDMFICQNPDELKSCLRDGVEYLIQEYIEKEYELDCVGFSYNHGNDVFIPAVVRKIRDEIHRQSVYIRLDDINDYANLNVDCIRKFLKETRYEGIFSIETIFSKGKYYFLEINLRNDGCQWIYSAAGVNYPYLWTLYSESRLQDNILTSIKPQTPYYLMDVLNDIYNLCDGKVSLKRWILDFFRTDTFFTFDILDPMPFIVGLCIHAKQLFKKLVRLA